MAPEPKLRKTRHLTPEQEEAFGNVERQAQYFSAIDLMNPDGSMNWDRWISSEPDIRGEFYAGIVVMIAAAPEETPDAFYDLLAMGINRDGAAFEAYEEKHPEAASVDVNNILKALRRSTSGHGAEILEQAITRYDSIGGEPVWDIASWVALTAGLSTAVAAGTGLVVGTGTTGTGAQGLVRGGLRPGLKLLAAAWSALGRQTIRNIPVGRIGQAVLSLLGLEMAATTTAAGIQAHFAPEEVWEADRLIQEGSQTAQNLVFGPFAPALRGMFGMAGGSPGVPTGPLKSVGENILEGIEAAYDPATGEFNWEKVPSFQRSEVEDNPPIGVSPDYEATRTYPGPDPTTGEPGLGTYKVPWQYQLSDFELIYSNWTPGQILDFQERAIKAGLLDPKAKADGIRFTKGAIGPATTNALFNLLTSANQSGWTWNEQLDRLVAMREAAPVIDDRGPFIRRAYVEPDYATLANTARSIIRQTLGREVNDWEMTMLAEEMKRSDKAAYESEEAARLSTWEAEGRALDEDREITSPSPVQGVDANARFAEFFEEKYATELQRGRTTRSVAQKSQGLMSGIQRMADMMGGS